MQLPTTDQVNAFARHIVTYVGGGMTVLAYLHLSTAGDAQKASDALNLIGHGVSEIMTGVGVLVPIAMGIIASLSASPLVQMLKGSKAIIANPDIAKQAPLATQTAIATAAVEMPKIKTVNASSDVANASTSPNVKAG